MKSEVTSITCCSNYNIKSGHNQEVLVDKGSSGRNRPWNKHKRSSSYLSTIYKTLGQYSKAERVKNCASYLDFAEMEEDNKYLRRADFCRVRLCPMCSWRRSLKAYSQTSEIMNELAKERKYSYIFLTLTVKNCEGKDLSKTIDLMMKAYHNMTRRAQWKKVFKGAIRSFEVTHNVNSYSELYDTYHPHVHVILAVDKEAYAVNEYFSHDDFVYFWREATGVDYDPHVYVEQIKGDTTRAILETTKYSVKSADYLLFDDWKLTQRTVKILDRALDKRRFISFCGILAETRKKLKLDDIENGNLINIDETGDDDTNYNLVRYIWCSGYSQYVKNNTSYYSVSK